MRSLADVASSTLTSLASYWLAFWALTGALDLALDTSVEMASVREPLMLAWFAAAAVLLAARFTPRRVRVPALVTVTLALALGTVVTRELTGLVAPWLQITIVGGMVLTAVGFTTSHRTLPLAAVLVIGVVLAPQRIDEMVRPDSPVQLGVPLMESLLVLGLGLLAALIRLVLLRSAEQADRTLDAAWSQRQLALAERSRADVLSAQMSLLHDTALNTLDAVSLGHASTLEDVRRRCLHDARRLRSLGGETDEPASGSWTKALDDLAARSAARGVELSVVTEVDEQAVQALPRSVNEAVQGALDEAALNVAKHARVSTADASVTVADRRIDACLVDRGVGFDPHSTPRGYGIERSIVDRLESVGGRASVVSRPGEGTTVRLNWAAEDDRADRVQDAVAAVVVRLVGALIVTTLLFTTGLVVAEWGAFERPAVALAGALLLGGWGLLLVGLLHRRGWVPTSLGVLTVALACVAPFWTVASDQYCSSSFSFLGWVDARVPLVITVMLTSRIWWRATAAVPAFVVAMLVAGTVWNQAFTGCGAGVITSASATLAILTASLFAGRILTRQSAQVASAQQQRDVAEGEHLRADALRDERRQWFAPAVDCCVPLLEGIGRGELDPTSDAVQQRCRKQSGYLRGLVSAAQAPPGIREGLRTVLESAHRAGLDIVVRGEFGQLPPPPEPFDRVLQEHLPPLGSADSLTITGIGGDGSGSLLLLAPGATAGADSTRRLSTELGRSASVVIDDIDGFWMDLSWTGDAAAVPAASS
jgi:signal transduction histidine kinase